MKIDPTEPHSIDDAPAPKLLREYVRATRRSGPDDTAIERMSSRLATAGVLPTPASDATAAPGSGRRLAYQKVALVAIVLSTGLVLSWRATRTELTTGTNVSAASSLAPSPGAPSPGAPSGANSPNAQAARSGEPAPVHATDDSKAAVSVDDLPTASPLVAASAPVTRSAARAGASASGESAGPPPPTELELVKRAQAALSSSPEQALAIAREQARAYPSGEFVQEREVIEVEALSRLGRKEEARRRAIAFVQRFPQTPYVPRLEVAVGLPLDAPSTSARPAAPHDPGRSRATSTP